MLAPVGVCMIDEVIPAVTRRGTGICRPKNRKIANIAAEIPLARDESTRGGDSRPARGARIAAKNREQVIISRWNRARLARDGRRFRPQAPRGQEHTGIHVEGKQARRELRAFFAP